MSTVRNARDQILQAAPIRTEPVMLPPTVIVPPGQLGPGSLPAGVLTPAGATFGQLAGQNSVNLASQVVGALSAGSVSGLGALALISTVNAQTQVYNLGNLAYANNIAANQIGAGTLAANVIYGGTINADRINGGSFSGKTFTGGTFQGDTALYAGGTTSTNADISIYGSDGGTVAPAITMNRSNSVLAIGAPNPADARFYVDGTTIWMNNVQLRGTLGSRIFLAETERYCSININGAVSNGSIRIGGLV